MAVMHTSFNVAGTNAGLAYDSEPFIPRVLPSSEIQCAVLMYPCCHIVGSIVTPCTLLLLEHWATCRNRRVSFYVN